MKFQKLVAIEPVNMTQEAARSLYRYAKEIFFYQDRPGSDEEILRRIGDADCVLVSYTTSISGSVIKACPKLRYIGMCCSLYSPESANVDILTAKEQGVTVTGIRDYGDEGVAEYVVSELVRLLHGFGSHQWKKLPTEITGQKVGIVGLGTSGRMIGDGLKYFGARLFYYSRTRKPEAEQAGYGYLPLKELLANVDILCTCLNKNTVLLYQQEFEWFGNGKILFNTSISPSYDVRALADWLKNPTNYYFCDTEMALGDQENLLSSLPNVFCSYKSSGYSEQSIERLGRKVIQNVENYLAKNQ